MVAYVEYMCITLHMWSICGVCGAYICRRRWAVNLVVDGGGEAGGGGVELRWPHQFNNFSDILGFDFYVFCKKQWSETIVKIRSTKYS